MPENKNWKYGDRIVVAVMVRGVLKGQTNEQAPVGLSPRQWWVQLDGEIGLRAVQEDAFITTDAE